MSEIDTRLRALIEADPKGTLETLQKLEQFVVTPHESQLEILNSQARFKVVCAGRRFGKTKIAAKLALEECRKPDKVVWWVANAQPLSAPVLTPNGWATMRDIKPGSEVVGSDGRPTTVLSVHPHHKRVHRVRFSDGSTVECSPDHLWEVSSFSGRARSRKVEVLRTRDILERGLEDPQRGRFSVRNPAPVQHPEADLPIDPYLLGTLLGDGTICHSTVRFTTADEQLLRAVEAGAGVTAKPYGTYDYGLPGADSLRASLAELGLRGTRAADKFVPTAYTTASVPQRLELLRGLLDTDGSVRKGGGYIFTSISRDLADAVAQLARSLGGSATVAHNGRFVVQGGFCNGIVPFALERKRARFQQSPRSWNKQIVAIEDLGYDEDMQCIQVEADDSLYITQDYTLTHNTYQNTIRGYREVLRQVPPSILTKSPPPPTLGAAGRMVLNFPGSTRFEFYSGQNPDAMAGEGVDFVVVDEAALQGENVWSQIIRPTLMDTAGRALLISTPRGKNWFYHLWQRGQDPEYREWASWHFTTANNPYIRPEEVEEAQRSLPLMLYEQEILAEFVSDAGAVFRTRDDVFRGIHDVAGHHIFLGVDLAKHHDFTVITGSRGDDRMPCWHERFNAVSWPMQKDRLITAIDLLEQAGATGVTVIMDSTGLGDVVFDDLELEGIDIVPVKFTNDWKMRAVSLLAADLERGNAFILREQQREFEAYSYEVSEVTGRFRYGAPEGAHDDEVSAKLLEHWGVVHEGAPTMRTVDAEDSPLEEATVVDGTAEEIEVASPSALDVMLNEDVWS